MFNQIYNQVWNAVENQVSNQLWSKVEIQVRNRVWDQVNGGVGFESIRRNWVVFRVNNQIKFLNER